MLRLKFQYFGHLRRTADSLEKSLMLGRIEGRRRRGQQSWLDDITNVNLGKLGVDDEQEAWCVADHWVAKSQTRLGD